MGEAVLAQAINSVGYIDPGWVLACIAGLSAFLFWNQIKDIKESLKHILDLVQLHDKEIARMKDKMGMQ